MKWDVDVFKGIYEKVYECNRVKLSCIRDAHMNESYRMWKEPLRNARVHSHHILSLVCVGQFFQFGTTRLQRAHSLRFRWVHEGARTGRAGRWCLRGRAHTHTPCKDTISSSVQIGCHRTRSRHALGYALLSIPSQARPNSRPLPPAHDAPLAHSYSQTPYCLPACPL